LTITLLVVNCQYSWKRIKVNFNLSWSLYYLPSFSLRISQYHFWLKCKPKKLLRIKSNSKRLRSSSRRERKPSTNIATKTVTSISTSPPSVNSPQKKKKSVKSTNSKRSILSHLGNGDCSIPKSPTITVTDKYPEMTLTAMANIPSLGNLKIKSLRILNDLFK